MAKRKTTTTTEEQDNGEALEMLARMLPYQKPCPANSSGRTETWFPRFSEKGVTPPQAGTSLNVIYACGYSGAYDCHTCLKVERDMDPRTKTPQ